MMNKKQSSLAPGARVTIRDEDWIVRRVDISDDGGYALTCDGLSELVRGLTSLFLTKLEDDVVVHDPAETELFIDESPESVTTRLFLEATRLRVYPNDKQIHLADRAVMRRAAYQRIPSEKGLSQPRTRLLIADGVGLGKTMEAAMLATELDIRGRGRRVLVVTQKSMLTQFQKEWWSRFSLPLVRLDSAGIQRIRDSIPAGHNPFNYYDKTIISMDTLKGNAEFRGYLEKSRWDIIIIDECHNVAARKGDTGLSKRARLAKMLATRSDSLILLSATPHDGSAASFASLIWLLDPTAISNPEDYSREDLDRKDLFVRRHKKDIKESTDNVFLESVTERIRCTASSEEDAAYARLLDVRFTQKGEFRPGKGKELQRVGLEKALLSSPAAAIKTVENRIGLLQKGDQTGDVIDELSDLNALLQSLQAITPSAFQKYTKLLDRLGDVSYGWNPKDSSDRLVIFSERIETLKWLEEHLTKDLKLKPAAITQLHGGMSDLEQQAIVERFGQLNEPLRILLCSDVASEGLNLHFQCHRLMHFDLPWSPMVFAQRNGRVDRFGQSAQPLIDYFLTISGIERVRDDMRVIEVLVQKDEQIGKNIGDAASVMRKHSVEEEEKAVEDALVRGESAESFESELDAMAEGASDEAEEDWFFSDEGTGFIDDSAEGVVVVDQPPVRFFEGDYAFATSALKQIPEAVASLRTDDRREMLQLTPPSDLRRRLQRQLPAEVYRGTQEFTLSSSITEVDNSIEAAREADKQGNAWPEIQFLWPQHPMFQWMIDRVNGNIGRRRAPVIVSEHLPKGEVAFLMMGLIPNRKGQPLITDWKAVIRRGKDDVITEDFDAFCRRAKVDSEFVTSRYRDIDTSGLREALGDAVALMQLETEELVDRFAKEQQQKVADKVNELNDLKGRQQYQLELRIEDLGETARERRRRERSEAIEEVFSEYETWVRDSMTVEKSPHVQVLAGVVGVN